MNSGNNQADSDLEKNFVAEYIAALRTMYIIRTSEILIAEKRKNNFIGGPVHLAAGQEAIATGISTWLTKEDIVFSAHRSHAHLLALGTRPYKLFAELLGKASGLSKGMGGSMHLIDVENGFYGSVPIVAATVPIAVGAALALKLNKKESIAVVYFGDGASEEGVVHESMNLARQLSVPVFFVCENNSFSSHMHISKRQPLSSIARYAQAHDIKNYSVDGNDLIAVQHVAKELITFAKTTKMPVFLEALTHRQYGHVDWRLDIDVGVYRSEVELNFWKQKDPIRIYENFLLSKVNLKRNDLESVKESVEAFIVNEWNFAFLDPILASESYLEFVYRS